MDVWDFPENRRVCVCVCDLCIICHLKGKKDVAQIFNNILRRQIGTRTPTVEYLCTQQNILFMLLKG